MELIFIYLNGHLSIPMIIFHSSPLYSDHDEKYINKFFNMFIKRHISFFNQTSTIYKFLVLFVVNMITCSLQLLVELQNIKYKLNDYIL